MGQLPGRPRKESESDEESDGDTGHPCGLKELYVPDNPTVDICFVHGLGGHRTSTWAPKRKKEPWLKTLLPLDLPSARILAFGYDSGVVKGGFKQASKGKLKHHASSLLTDLADNRAHRKASKRPLIFVAHSLGGLVCKAAVLQSKDKSKHDYLRSIYKVTKGFIFLGTPHAGSYMAECAKVIAFVVGKVKSTNPKLLEVLTPNNEILKEIQDKFIYMVVSQQNTESHIHVRCFCEELGVPVLGEVVVSTSSAYIPGFQSDLIPGDHSTMVKFTNASDTGYVRVLAALRQCVPSSEYETCANPRVAMMQLTSFRQNSVSETASQSTHTTRPGRRGQESLDSETSSLHSPVSLTSPVRHADAHDASTSRPIGYAGQQRGSLVTDTADGYIVAVSAADRRRQLYQLPPSVSEQNNSRIDKGKGREAQSDEPRYVPTSNQERSSNPGYQGNSRAPTSPYMPSSGSQQSYRPTNAGTPSCSTPYVPRQMPSSASHPAYSEYNANDPTPRPSLSPYSSSSQPFERAVEPQSPQTSPPVRQVSDSLPYRGRENQQDAAATSSDDSDEDAEATLSHSHSLRTHATRPSGQIAKGGAGSRRYQSSRPNSSQLQRQHTY